MRVRRTPCVGVCSTTYGDLVCRGCKRFAHEIVGWNGYTDDQRQRIRARLDELREQSVNAYVRVVDEQRFASATNDIPDASTMPRQLLCLELLRRGLAMDDVGIAPANDPAEMPVSELVRAIDREFYVRSSAYYERSFKIRST